MRIISGKYKGHNLVDFDAKHIRPTTDRVKESLFNIIQGYIDDSRALDLFGGTGNLGLEALSRGAKDVTFVEKNPDSIAIIKKNFLKLKVNEGVRVVAQDVLKFLQEYEGPPFDLVFVDPPFTEKMAHEVMLHAAKSKIWAQHTILTIESAKKERLDSDYETVVQFDQRVFGDKILSFFKLKE